MTTPFFHRRLANPERVALLQSILDRVRAAAPSKGSSPRSGRTSVIVFDLDGTLMDNRPRVVAILHELARHWDARHPDAAASCAKAEPEGIVYGFGENLRRLGVADPALHEEGFAFWKARFFADPHVKHDTEIRGAAAFARACHASGATVVYLTGRDLPNMALGSFASLRDLGFPIGVIGTELVVKPTFETPDAVFKRDVAPEVERLGELVASFDNEPANCNAFREMNPDAEVVFVDTQHLPGAPPLEAHVHIIADFRMR